MLPRFAIGPYTTEFNASLAEQDALTVGDAWRVNGWLTQVARVREGADRFAATLSAHEALCAPLDAGDLKLVQFPHRPGEVWAALPQAWREDEGTPFDPKQVPEELRDYLAARPGAPYRDIQRVVPDVLTGVDGRWATLTLKLSEHWMGVPALMVIVPPASAEIVFVAYSE